MIQAPTTVTLRKLIVILGIPIDELNMAEALDRLEAFVHIGRATGKSHQVATINADFVVKALGDPELRYLLQEADMATADGMPLVWGARLLGVPLESRVAGADLIPALAERAAQKGFSIYFLGAAPGVAARAAQVLQAKYSNLIVAGITVPPYSSVLEMDPAILNDIRAARPDILLVAFGNPKQEKWIGMYGSELCVPVMIGVGGTLDFIAGHTRRAPAWMQRVGLEWLHRLLREPRRLWRRYMVDLFAFSSFFARQWWLMRRYGTPLPLLPAKTDVMVIAGTAVLNVHGRLDVGNYMPFNEHGQQALMITPFIVVNLAGVEFMDSSAIGALVGLAKQARDAGGELWLAAVPQPIQRTLALLRLDRFFTICDSLNASLIERRRRAQNTPVPVQVHGRWTVISVPRRLDATTSPALLARSQAALDDNPHLVLDFAETFFLASAGLALLSQLHRMTVEQKGSLRIAGCSPDVLRVIKMVRFDELLSLYTDVTAATS